MRTELSNRWVAWLRSGALALLLVVSGAFAPQLALAQAPSSSFNHDTTMFPLRGSHEIVRCETCHQNGVFKGTPRDCNLCHIQGNRMGALPMSANHIPITQQCDVCHNASTFSGTQFTHVMVTPGTCNMCHNGFYAQGKGPTPPHPFTTASCDVCHTVGAFLPVAGFNHAAAGIFPAPAHQGAACASCHNGVKAVGQPPNHVPVPKNAACDTCHQQTIAWRPALFAHESVGISANPKLGAACTSCHNGSYSMGKPAGNAHIPTTQDCSLCHNSAPIVNPGGFSLGQMVHTGITNNCVSCHAVGTPYPPLAGKAVTNPNSIPNHIPFGTAACETCHAVGTFDNWSGAVMNHSVVTGLSCASCHEDGKTYAGLSSTANIVTRSGKGTHIPVPTSIACSVCHGSTNSFTQSVDYSTAATHQASVVSQGCNACHSSSVASSFASVPAIVSPTATASLSLSGLPHIAYSTTADCAVCHSAVSAYAPGSNGFRYAGSPSNPTLSPANHAFVAGNGACNTCHTSGQFAGLVASTSTVAADTVPNASLDPKHQAYTGDCGTCHTTTPLFLQNAFAGQPSGHIPTGAVTSCTVCHANGFTTPNIAATHTTGLACTACHNPTQSSAASTIGGNSPLIVFNGGNHIPIGSLSNAAATAGTPTCDSAGCHTNYGTNGKVNFVIGVASITNPTLNPAGHSSIVLAGVSGGCLTCHESTSPTYQGMLKGTTMAAPGDFRPTFDSAHTQTGDCGGCHSTQATFAQHVATVAQPNGHIPTGSAGCLGCHGTGTAGAFGSPSIALTHSSQSQPCEICHNATVSAGIAANQANLGNGAAYAKPTVYADNTHIPVGALTCTSNGCHSGYAQSAVFTLGAGSAGNINQPTLNGTGHATVASVSCNTCHGTPGGATSPFKGMAYNATATLSDFAPTASQDAAHPSYGTNCNSCHTTSPLFISNVNALPTGHIPTGTDGTSCAKCHANGVFTSGPSLNLVETHAATVSSTCNTCHSTAVAGTFLGYSSSSPIKNTGSVPHIPVGAIDCKASGCHNAYSAALTTFVIGAGSGGNINQPTLGTSGHATVASTSCNTCHAIQSTASSPFYGMAYNATATLSDFAPSAAQDAAHPGYGTSCSSCHTTSPVFASNVNGLPTGHIPTGTAGSTCSTCHAGGVYTSGSALNLVATHTATTSFSCLTCHATSVASTFLGYSSSNPIVSTASTTHIPVNTLDCRASGCHAAYSASATTFTISPGGNAGNISSPTLNTIGHSTVSGAGLTTCGTCHTGTATTAGTRYAGMVASNAAGGDMFPNSSEDAAHASYVGDCGACHTTTPTFKINVSGKPSNHIPTGTTACATCHTTPGQYGTTGLSLTATHNTGQTCLACHNATYAPGATVAGAFKVAYTGANGAGTSVTHIPVGNVDCAASGCHSQYSGGNAYPPTGGLFQIGAGRSGSVSSPTLSVGGHTTAMAQTPSVTCGTCHTNQGTVFTGMVAATGGGNPGNDEFPFGDGAHPAFNTNCQSCHTTSPQFSTNATAVPSNHIPVGSAACTVCHTTPTNYSLVDLNAVHSATGEACATCHNSTYAPGVTSGVVAGTTAWKVAYTGADSANAVVNHIPIGSGANQVACNSSGCHSGYSGGATYPPSGNGFAIGVGIGGSITSPTLTVTGHATVAAQQGTCSTCHTSALSGGVVYAGMKSSATAVGDQVPSASVDSGHPSTTGTDCVTCHSTTPTFASNAVAGLPTNHIPVGTTTCVTCHTNSANYSIADLSATHNTGQACAACHNATLASGVSSRIVSGTTPWKVAYTGADSSNANVTHIPIGTGTSAVACNSSGCHSGYSGGSAYPPSGNGFAIGVGIGGSITSPTLTVAGHATVQAAQGTCSTCHTAVGGTLYAGMVSTASTVGDQIPSASGTVDPSHPQTGGDCSACHSTTPTFAKNAVGGQPTNHIPVGTATCVSCHTTSSNYSLADLNATHTLTGQACAACHNATLANGVTSGIVSGTTPWKVAYTGADRTNASVTHIPIGTGGSAVACNASGCHSGYAGGATYPPAGNGFSIGTGIAGSIISPTLSVSGHATVGAQVNTCRTCHTLAGGVLYAGMVSSSATVGDQVPSAAVDSAHPSTTSTDCVGCHSTIPTFASNASAGSVPSNHIPLSTFPSTPPCSNCHISSSSYNVAQMNHSGLTGNCVSCHGAAGAALNFANIAPTPAPSNHIPTNMAGVANACQQCHRNALTGNFTSFSGTVMDHTGISGGCMTCHAVGRTSAYYGVTMVVPPNGSTDGHQYVASVECSSCHTNTQVTGGFVNGTFKHASAPTGTCIRCHELGSKFTGVTNLWVRPSANHNAGRDCSGGGCHNTSDKSLGTGTTAEPQALLSPTALTLSSPAVGTGTTGTVTLTNSGTAALSVTSLALSGTNAGDFTQTNSCGTSVAVGGNCTITVTFKPTAAGNRTATITVTDSAPSKTQTIALTGAVATTSLSASSVVALTSTAVGTTSAPQSLTFRNLSTAAVSVISVTTSGTNAADFLVTNGCTASVAANGSCTISVAFKPTTAATQERGSLNIVDSGSPASYTLQLVGSVASVSSATAKVGKAVVANVTATNGKGAATTAAPLANGAVVNGTNGQRGLLSSLLSLVSPGVAGAAQGGAVAVTPAAAAAGTGTASRGLLGLAAGATAAAPAAGEPSAQASRGVAAAEALLLSAAPSKSAAGGGLPSANIAARGITAVPGAAQSRPGIAGMPPFGASAAGLPAFGAPSSANGGVAGAASGPTPGVGLAAGQSMLRGGLQAGSALSAAGAGGLAATTSLPSGHLQTALPCATCHLPGVWRPLKPYQHRSAQYPQHSSFVACTSCHVGTFDRVVTKYPQFGNTCAACHANQFRPQQHRRADKPNQFYQVMDLRDCAGACHVALPGRLAGSPTQSSYHRSTASAF